MDLIDIGSGIRMVFFNPEWRNLDKMAPCIRGHGAVMTGGAKAERFLRVQGREPEPTILESWGFPATQEGDHS